MLFECTVTVRTPKHFVVTNCIREFTVGVHVAEVQLATFLKERKRHP